MNSDDYYIIAYWQKITINNICLDKRAEIFRDDFKKISSDEEQLGLFLYMMQDIPVDDLDHASKVFSGCGTLYENICTLMRTDKLELIVFKHRKADILDEIQSALAAKDIDVKLNIELYLFDSKYWQHTPIGRELLKSI